jgi:hypothetical protein
LPAGVFVLSDLRISFPPGFDFLLFGDGHEIAFPADGLLRAGGEAEDERGDVYEKLHSQGFTGSF